MSQKQPLGEDTVLRSSCLETGCFLPSSHLVMIWACLGCTGRDRLPLSLPDKSSFLSGMGAILVSISPQYLQNTPLSLFPCGTFVPAICMYDQVYVCILKT